LTVVVCLFALCSSGAAATLTITVNGTNTGAVSVQPGGQVCNSASVTTCTYTVATGTTIKLAADSPSTPGLFNSGTGEAAACAPTSTCTFVIQNDSSLVATFSAAGLQSRLASWELVQAKWASTTTDARTSSWGSAPALSITRQDRRSHWWAATLAAGSSQASRTPRATPPVARRARVCSP
jgi:hypothetical protein